MRWFLTLNGQECADPGPIDIALAQNFPGTTITYDLTRPASIVGICRGIEGGALLAPLGDYSVELMVGPCARTDMGNGAVVPEPAHTTTGYNSVSRFVVEEIPDSRHDCNAQILLP